MQDLSNIHEFATEEVNTPGLRTPILEISPDSGLALVILTAAARGTDLGVPIYADLRNSSDENLPLDTELLFEFERPGNDSDKNRVSEVRDNIQPYNNLTITEQQDMEFIDSVKIPLLGDAVITRDIDSFYVSVTSSEEIDWQYSQLYIEGSAVTEENME